MASALAEAISKFAMDLYQTLIKENHVGNIFFSPFSISVVLAMVYEGAKTETREEMKKTLHFGDLDVAEAMYSLLTLLDDSKPFTLESANRLYIQDKHPIVQEYIEKIRTKFSSDVVSCNFAEQSGKIRQEINQWVSQKTSGKIVNLISPGAFDRFTRLVLINAIYFKGNWLSKFNISRTKQLPFYSSPSNSADVAMMFQEKTTRYSEREDIKCQVLELPYIGKRLSMILLLPLEKNGIHDVEQTLANLSQDIFTSMSSSMTEETVKVYIPKFKFDQYFDLNSTLKAMGMIKLFKENGECDLSGVNATDFLYVSNVLHQAFIEVNEKGTKASAATAAVVSLALGFKGPSEIIFKADHPFIFFIQDNRSKAILFFGKFSNV